VNVVQECNNRIEGVHMMHVGHAMHVCGGIMHHYAAHVLLRCNQKR